MDPRIIEYFNKQNPRRDIKSQDTLFLEQLKNNTFPQLFAKFERNNQCGLSLEKYRHSIYDILELLDEDFKQKNSFPRKILCNKEIKHPCFDNM